MKRKESLVLGFDQIDPTQQQRKLFVTQYDLALRITGLREMFDIHVRTPESPARGTCCRLRLKECEIDKGPRALEKRSDHMPKLVTLSDLQ